MKFKNMKIAITSETHLKEVCEALDSMGYKQDYRTNWISQTVKTLSSGLYQIFLLHESERSDDHDLVTLPDLIKMRDEMVKGGLQHVYTECEVLK